MTFIYHTWSDFVQHLRCTWDIFVHLHLKYFGLCTEDLRKSCHLYADWQSRPDDVFCFIFMDLKITMLIWLFNGFGKTLSDGLICSAILMSPSIWKGTVRLCESCFWMLFLWSPGVVFQVWNWIYCVNFYCVKVFLMILYCQMIFHFVIC